MDGSGGLGEIGRWDGAAEAEERTYVCGGEKRVEGTPASDASTWMGSAFQLLHVGRHLEGRTRSKGCAL